MTRAPLMWCDVNNRRCNRWMDSNPSLMQAWLGKTKKPWIASGDPSRGEASKPEKNTPEACFIFCFTEPPYESKLSTGLKKKTVHCTRFSWFGGERGIRTPGPSTRTTVFKTAAFDRSAIPPLIKEPYTASRSRVYPSPRNHFSISFLLPFSLSPFLFLFRSAAKIIFF